MTETTPPTPSGDPAEQAARAAMRTERDELVILDELVPLSAQRIIELGCGAARTTRRLLLRWPDCRVTGLEVDAVQHAKNLEAPTPHLRFLHAGAQAIPLPDASFDLALMLKSLHHVPVALMDRALAEARRVLRPGACLYVSEPVYAGNLNALMRLVNDEGVVRAQAQAALDRAAAGSDWQRVADLFFDVPVHFADFADFQRRMLNATFVVQRKDAGTLERLRALFAPHQAGEGAFFTRPMHVTLLRAVGQRKAVEHSLSMQEGEFS